MSIQALILPIIDYGDVCTMLRMPLKSLNKLERLLNNGIRFITYLNNKFLFDAPRPGCELRTSRILKLLVPEIGRAHV